MGVNVAAAHVGALVRGVKRNRLPTIGKRSGEIAKIDIIVAAVDIRSVISRILRDRLVQSVTAAHQLLPTVSWWQFPAVCAAPGAQTAATAKGSRTATIQTRGDTGTSLQRMFREVRRSRPYSTASSRNLNRAATNCRYSLLAGFSRPGSCPKQPCRAVGTLLRGRASSLGREANLPSRWNPQTAGAHGSMAQVSRATTTASPGSRGSPDRVPGRGV